jgi:hypothetical protein
MKKISKRYICYGTCYCGCTPKSIPNFTISLSVTIITLLSPTRPRHPNTKILHVSFLVPSPIGLKISNNTQKFLKKWLFQISYAFHKDSITNLSLHGFVPNICEIYYCNPILGLATKTKGLTRLRAKRKPKNDTACS